MPFQGSQTVLVFKELEFVGDWSRSFGANAITYTPQRSAKLVVLVEDHGGNNITYYFALGPAFKAGVKTHDDVWVCYGGDAQVHIPALCLKSEPGDHIRCSD
jgi:hypothetical protein